MSRTDDEWDQEITQLQQRNAKLVTENWQLRQACGYSIPANKETINNPFKCGTCAARYRFEKELDERNAELVAALDALYRLAFLGIKIEVDCHQMENAREALQQSAEKP